MRTIIHAAVFLCLAVSTVSAGTKPHRTTPFRDDFNGAAVDTMVWEVADWKEHGGQTGVERCFVRDGMLCMQFVNDADKGFLNSALQTRDEFLYGIWEFRAKPTGVKGVLNSFYTIDWNDRTDTSSGSNGTKQEIDIEFLTKSFTGSDGRMHCAVHGRPRPSWGTEPDVLLGFDPSAGFHTYGFEITPEYIAWSADGKEIQRYTYADPHVFITDPYMLKLNTWSAVKWIEGPSAPGVVSEYLIDWISFTPAAGK